MNPLKYTASPVPTVHGNEVKKVCIVENHPWDVVSQGGDNSFFPSRTNLQEKIDFPITRPKCNLERASYMIFSGS